MTAAGSAGLGNPAGSEGPARLLLGPWLLALMATELLVLFSGNAVAEAAGAVLVLGTPLIGWRRLRLREGYLLCLCAALFALARSEEHTSELQSLLRISYAVFCMKNTPATTLSAPN